MAGIRLGPDAASALRAKRQIRAELVRKLNKLESIPAPRRQLRKGSANVLSMSDYPLGRFENLGRNRLRWVAPDFFEFIPKQSQPFAFIRHTGEKIVPKNFFTDGASIPRPFQWNVELDPFGSALCAALIHDWEFDRHHCGATKPFNEVANTCMEALRTLMQTGIVPTNTYLFWLIEQGINSFVAQALWNATGPCPIPPFKPE